MKPPTVTTLICCKDQGKYLSQAIDSILNQTFKPTQFILLDDGSSDNTSQIMKKYADKDKRFQTIRHERNLGNIRAYNHGLELCTSEFFHLMAADDIMEDKYFYEEAALALMQMPECAFATIGLIWMNDDGQLLSTECLPPIAGRVTPETGLDLMAQVGNWVNGGGTLIRSSVQRQVGFYDGDYKYTADYLNWAKVFAKGYSAYCFRRPGYRYRRHEKQMTAKGVKIPEKEILGVQEIIKGALRELSVTRNR